METKGELAKAVIAVMKELKGIDKSMVIGSGTNSYKGVPDQEVKKIIGQAMAENGLCILPIGVDAKTQIDRWEETNNYGTKMKQSVFTEATCKYLLLHTSGESQELMGYGQGVDSQDKSAGKSTTYSLKYLLLYTFLVPTGKIDDADNTHSDDISTPQKTTSQQVPTANTEQDYEKLIKLFDNASLAKVTDFYQPDATKPITNKAKMLAGLKTSKEKGTLTDAHIKQYTDYMDYQIDWFTKNPIK